MNNKPAKEHKTHKPCSIDLARIWTAVAGFKIQSNTTMRAKLPANITRGGIRLNLNELNLPKFQVGAPWPLDHTGVRTY